MNKRKSETNTELFAKISDEQSHFIKEGYTQFTSIKLLLKYIGSGNSLLVDRPSVFKNAYSLDG